MRKTLFRSNVLLQQQDAWHGKAILIQPVSLRIISAVVMLSAIACMLFLWHGQYTRRISAAGVLAPDSGLIKVQSPQSGIILERRVREGQHVHAGDVLYVVSAEVMYAPQSGSQARAGETEAQLEQLRARQALIQADSANSAVIARREHSELQTKIASLQAELQQLDQEIAVQQERVKAKNEVYQRHAQAQAQGFLSPLALQQKYDELLDYKSRVQTMQRTRLSLTRDLESARVQLDTVEQRNALSRSQLERQVVDLRQDRVTREANERMLVIAPQDGVVAAVLAEPGKRVDREAMLLIVPQQSRLEVQVLLPSSAVGFIREGDPVTLRFDSFPSQRYGSVTGTIREISQAALLDTEAGEARGNRVQPGDGFRVRIALSSQSFSAGGHDFPLRSGMKAEAQFAQERHSLLAWMTAPLASLTDKT
jgi:membrane fusion protein